MLCLHPIIESGIDMPTVNTLVVERADLLGLGQMHQLRGRVGRSGQRAYAYLFHPADRVLTEEAYERLRTIGEATELGSGFKIAMRDLEIRGAGNLLGENQSGHIAAVGYDLYVQMVNEAVAEMKGEAPREPAEVKLDVPTDAYLPLTTSPRRMLRWRLPPPGRGSTIAGGRIGPRGRTGPDRAGARGQPPRVAPSTGGASARRCEFHHVERSRLAPSSCARARPFRLRGGSGAIYRSRCAAGAPIKRAKEPTNILDVRNSCSGRGWAPESSALGGGHGVGSAT